MNNLHKQLIGAIAGGAIGYFIGCVIMEIIILKEMEEDYHDTEEFPEGTEADKITPERALPTAVKKLVVNKPKKKNYSKYFALGERPELAELVAKYNSEPIEEKVDHIVRSLKPTTEVDEDEQSADESVERFFEEQYDNGDIQPISVISLQEYAGDDDFDHITLNYYDDDVVTDEHGEPIDRPEQILGDEALVSFGELSEDEDVVYVRNLPKKAMYEVVRTNKNYAAELPKKRRAPLSRAVKEEGDEENRRP